MSNDGFTLIEMLMALVLTLLITTTALGLSNPHQLVVQAQAEAMDMQQRVRVAMDPLLRDLMMAGAGMYAGARTGSFASLFPSVLPRKVGLNGTDPPSVARADAISILYVPVTLTQTTSATIVPDAAGLTVEAAPNCPAGDPLCGLQLRMAIVVFDEAGRHDVFSVTGLQNGAAQIQPHTPTPPLTYAAGAHVAQVEARSFYLDSGANQLRQYDGYQTDVPVVDNVVGLGFEYFGDPSPPIAPKPPMGTENCLYDTAGQLKPLPGLAGEPGEIVPLPLSVLNDGPWCGSGDMQFDADLLRVRTVRVSIRVQAALAEFRATGSRFSNPGTSRSSARALPDLTATWRVSPRNLSLGR